MKIHEIITEGVAGPKSCWPGHRKVGTQPGTGKNKGKSVNDCKKIKEELTPEEQFDIIEEMVNQLAESNNVDPEVVWEDFESLDDNGLYTLSEDWQKVNKKDKTDGMSKKAVNAYRRENPGSKLKTAVTTKPSKLKKGSKASKRRSSYCSRSAGQKKMHSIDCSKTPDKAICKARRRWNC
jgi:spore germination protein YaaH